MVEAQLHQKLHQQSLELEKFQKKVHKRLKKQKYESCDKDLVVVEKHVPSLNVRKSNEIFIIIRIIGGRTSII